nr:AzlC family ABC transporter permease [uncultured Acetatifactor sp.]
MKNRTVKEIRFAFAQSVPVMLGYLFLGIAFGLMLQDAGYSFWWALLSSVVIYAGSMQFVLVTLLTGGASLLYTAAMTLFVNGRHIFYGLSFIEKFRGMGKRYPYMVFSLTDETYSVLCGLKTPEGLDEKNISFMISLFDHIYWIIGSVLGAVIGQLITFDTTGVDFSMTALFVVIVLNQWMDSKEHRPAIIGGAVGIICLILIGAEGFLLPALTLTAAILMGVRRTWNIR